jgi:bacterioferritin
MKGNKKLIDAMNGLLMDELTAINQYMVHSEMCENWGYDSLGKMIQARAITEMKHAEKLIARILFLEGTPIVSKLGKVSIGQEVPKMVANDVASEYDAVKAYNAAGKLAAEVNDNATKEVLDHILDDEDRHANELEEQRDQIEQMTLPVYLSTQTD